MADKKEDSKKKELKGIGGWLLLPTIGFILSAVFWSVMFFILGVLIIFGDFDSEIIQYFVVSVISAGLSIYVLTLLFKKKKEFPKRAIYVIWIGVGMGVILSIFTGDFSDTVTGVASSLLWTLYLQRSKRVKNTFVN